VNESELQFLKNLLHSPGTSGYEAVIQQVVRDFAGTFADDVSTDWHGNVTAAVNPKGSPRVMLAGHCDQIGFLVQHVDEMGYLRLSPVGGWDVQMLIGQKLVVWTADGPVNGVVARKAIHLLTDEERKQVPKLQELWLDIGARGEAEARELVRIGDPVTLELGFRPMRNGLASAPGMDDRVGVWVVMDALRQVAKMNPKASVFAVSTVAEEIGLRGAQTAAFRIDPQIGIAVDVTHATDCPGIDQNQYGRVKVGDGPVVFRGPNVNPLLFDRLTDLAHKHEVPIQTGAVARAASNDGNVMQVNRAGVATGIVGIPNRYMHSPVEVVALSDLTHAARLIALFCASVDASTDMTPRA
jgi:endoglucanase